MLGRCSNLPTKDIAKGRSHQLQHVREETTALERISSESGDGTLIMPRSNCREKVTHRRVDLSPDQQRPTGSRAVGREEVTKDPSGVAPLVLMIGALLGSVALLVMMLPR